MSSSSGFQELQKKVWKSIVKKGCEEASSALEVLFRSPFRMSGVVMGFIPISKIPFLAGNPEQIVRGARMVFSGDISGHVLLLLSLKGWETCWKLLLAQTRKPEDDKHTMEELESSAFSEMTNIACSFFMVNLADATGFTIRFVPPEVMNDMTATVLEDTLIEFSEDSTDLLTIEATFSGGDTEMKGYLFFIPSPASVKEITQRFLQVMPSPAEEGAE